MNQKSLSNWLLAVIIGTGIFGAIVFAFLVPRFGYELTVIYPEMQNRFWPWLIFLWLCSLPCFASLFFGWGIAKSIGMDDSFSFENSRRLKIISVLAAADSAFFFLGNWALLFMNLSHPEIALLFSGLITFVGIAVSVVCAALSHLVYKSAVMKKENDLTI